MSHYICLYWSHLAFRSIFLLLFLYAEHVGQLLFLWCCTKKVDLKEIKIQKHFYKLDQGFPKCRMKDEKKENLGHC